MAKMKLTLLTIDQPSMDNRDYLTVVTEYTEKELELEIKEFIKGQSEEGLENFFIAYEVMEYLIDKGIIHALDNIDNSWVDLDDIKKERD